MANALFDFDLDGGDRGFEAVNGETYTLRLRQQPPIGVDSVLFQVWDPAGSNPLLGIAANPPRASKSAPVITLEGASSGSAVSPATLDGSVSITAPASGGHSYIVRCVVNGGKRTLTNGKQVVDPTLIHERGFFVRTALGSRKIVCTERQEFEVEGFAGALSDMMDSAGGEGGGGIAAGSYVGQPAAWDGSAWVPLEAGDPLVLDRLSSTAELLIDSPSIALEGEALGFFDQVPVSRPSIIGESDGAALSSLISALVALGLVSDDRFP